MVSPSARWADMLDSDPDDSVPGGQGSILGQVLLAPVPEDSSYQGVAMESVEDSKEGLNGLFAGTLALTRQESGDLVDAVKKKQAAKKKPVSTPKDFGFLLNEEEIASTIISGDPKEGEEPRAPATPHNAGTRTSTTPKEKKGKTLGGAGLNPDAMCFIPTCNPDIEPLAFFLHQDPSSPLFSTTPTPSRSLSEQLLEVGGAFSPSRRQLRHADSDPCVTDWKLPPKRDRAHTVETPDKSLSGSLTPSSVKSSEKALPLGAPERKRSRFCDLVQKRGRPGKNKSGSSIGDSSSEATLAPGEMPEQTEEEWQQRMETRRKNILDGKALETYKLYLELVPRDSRDPEEPMTPNHEDRMVSKRAWKEKVINWRIAVRDRVRNAQDSPVDQELPPVPNTP